MSIAVEDPTVPGPSGEPSRSSRRLPLTGRLPLIDVVSVLAAAAPFWVVGILYGVTGRLVLGGDQSLIALDLLDVRHLDQAVGPYSRMGWAHPGPAWYYLMAPLFWLFGSSGQALVAASMLIEGIVAALVVVAAGWGRRWQRPLMAGLLLLYVLRMPSIDFVAVWNPFALLLPVVLLLLLAARACAGSTAAFATSLIVASFLVQTHVGTVPLVGLVGIVALVAVVVRLVRRPEQRPDRAQGLRIALPLVVAVLMWLPPLWQQVTAPPRQGNLANLARWLVHGDPSAGAQTWHDALSGVGQMLGAPVYGWPAEPALIRPFLTPAVLAAVAAQVVGGVVVAALAHRLGECRIGWLAVMTVLGTVAGLVSAKTVTGPLMNYLILWISVLPALLLSAGLSLVLAWAPAMPARWVTRFAAALAAGSVAGSAVIGLAFDHAADTRLPSQPGAHDAARLALAALPPPRPGDPPVLLDIRDISVWTTATEVAFELERAGYRYSVEQKWVYGFGTDRRSTGNERWRLVMVPVSPSQVPPAGDLGTVVAISGPMAVALEPARG